MAQGHCPFKQDVSFCRDFCVCAQNSPTPRNVPACGCLPSLCVLWSWQFGVGGLRAGGTWEMALHLLWWGHLRRSTVLVVSAGADGDPWLPAHPSPTPRLLCGRREGTRGLQKQKNLILETVCFVLSNVVGGPRNGGWGYSWPGESLKGA